MSYILEALKKAEQQRELGHVPGIASTHEQAYGKGRGRWLWVLTVVLALNAAVLLVLFWPDHGRAIRADAADEAASAQQRAPERPATAPVPAAVERPLAALAPATALPPAVSAAALSEPRQADSAAGPPAGSAAASEPEQPISDAPERAVTRHIAPPSLPVWPQIPGHLFEQLSGSLHLDVHVYADRPPDRFVLINMKKYHQGERLQEGPRLDEITTDGVILSFRGEKFRVQAQH